ncbi:MAG: hypothetical protein ABFS45_19130 [Pseudomonadota bacterium]
MADPSWHAQPVGLALVSISAMGVIAGRTILARILKTTLHRISGIFFLALAGISLYKAIDTLLG